MIMTISQMLLAYCRLFLDRATSYSVCPYNYSMPIIATVIQALQA